MNGSMNALIRRAAGYDGTVLEPARQQREGLIGVGLGGSSAPARRVTTNEQINARIRAGARLVRSVSVPGGVRLDSVDVDNLWR
jgi:hypothetical protein